MANGLTVLAIQHEITARILAHYRIERRYPGSPAEAMGRVLRAWERVAADYAAEHRPAPDTIAYGVQLARIAAASIEVRPPYWHQSPQ